MRLSVMLMALILFALGCNVYAVADRVQNAEKTQRRIEASITDEREGIRVLSAEWTFLTNPDRLERLATEHFGLIASEGQQCIELAAIPMRDFMDQQQQDNTVQLADAAPKNAMPLRQTPVNQAADKKAVELAEQPVLQNIHPAALPQAAAQPLPALTAIPVSATSGGISDE